MTKIVFKVIEFNQVTTNYDEIFKTKVIELKHEWIIFAWYADVSTYHDTGRDEMFELKHFSIAADMGHSMPYTLLCVVFWWNYKRSVWIQASDDT